MNDFEDLKRRFDDNTLDDVVQLAMDADQSEFYDAEDGEIILKL